MSRDETPQSAGSVVGSRWLGTIPPHLGRWMARCAGVGDRVRIGHAVSLRRLLYRTTGPFGPTVASGLVATPRSTPARGVVSWQHGTTVERKTVPSRPTLDEGVLVALAFAGNGFVTLAPDYIGLGRSPGVHPYYHVPSTVSAVVDLLAAAGGMTDGPLFLAGFSQGAHATVASVEALADGASGTNVVAAAAIAGAYDLSHLSVPRALDGESPNASVYLAYLSVSFANCYGRDVGTLLRPELAATVREVFDGRHDADAVMAGLPRWPRDLLHPDLIDAIDAGDDHWMLDRLLENDLVDSTPHVPVRLYSGQLDVDVHPDESIRQAARWRDRQVDVEHIDLGPVDHEGGVVEAVLSTCEWFDELAG